MPPPRPVVVYSTDASPHYLCMAHKSIETLRRFNRSATVRHVISGTVPDAYRRAVARLKVQLVERRASREHPLYKKWLALREVDEERALFVDADTFFFDDVDHLFERYQRRDFYARLEFGMEPGLSLSLVGTRPLATILDTKKHQRMARALKARVLPIFNSGLMVFNRGTHRALVHGDNLLFRTRDDIARKNLEWPFPEPHMHEQISASLALGRIDGLTYDYLDYEEAPFFIEWKANLLEHRGVVMHTWSGYYAHALLEFEGPRALRKLSPDAALYRPYRPNGRPAHRLPAR